MTLQFGSKNPIPTDNCHYSMTKKCMERLVVILHFSAEGSTSIGKSEHLDRRWKLPVGIGLKKVQLARH